MNPKKQETHHKGILSCPENHNFANTPSVAKKAHLVDKTKNNLQVSNQACLSALFGKSTDSDDGSGVVKWIKLNPPIPLPANLSMPETI